jgi:hypothetical protein
MYARSKPSLINPIVQYAFKPWININGKGFMTMGANLLIKVSLGKAAAAFLGFFCCILLAVTI